jgi:hypothetical protein
MLQQSRSSVCILRSRITARSLSTILGEHALIQSRVPFQFILDEDLARIDQFKVLLLPDSGCLSDKQLPTIRDFVEVGWGLVSTGEAGLYDSWHRLR